MRVLAVIAALLLAGPAIAKVEPFDPFGAAKVEARLGAQIPLDGRFTDSSGRTVTLRRLAAGKPLVIAPVQHHCPNLCGLTLDGLRKAVEGQGYKPGTDFTLVALGIDPREGPKDAALSARRLGAVALTGDKTTIRAVTDALGYRYAWDPRIGQYAHVAAVAVVGVDGRLASWLYGLAPEPTDLHLALTKAGRGEIGGVAEQIRLLCYHYDPQTGQYSNLALDMLRWGGGATVAAMVVAIGAGLWRERRRGRP